MLLTCDQVNFVIEGSRGVSVVSTTNVIAMSLNPSNILQRGVHDINHEMVFKSNERFIFHDSPGFEAGREDEVEKMRKFIAERTNTTFLNKQIHAIWCVGILCWVLTT